MSEAPRRRRRVRSAHSRDGSQLDLTASEPTTLDATPAPTALDAVLGATAANLDAARLPNTTGGALLPSTTGGGMVPGTPDVGAATGTSSAAIEAVAWVAQQPVDVDALPAERGLRGLIGSGSSQVSPTVALRARDAARPRPEDIARAEANLTIVRRNWSPRD